MPDCAYFENHCRPRTRGHVRNVDVPRHAATGLANAAAEARMRRPPTRTISRHVEMRVGRGMVSYGDFDVAGMQPVWCW
ncbi:hypothetical protein K523DRAFT_319971 [Schizophyllum commune Tattone D]|nr:hypothetical protein K523DRAFT_319971 [Schizophyllum commune Tattone D]